MLSVSDASAKQTFASSSSINLIPQVYAEWNYNTLNQPSITASSTSSEIISSLNPSLNLTLPANWSGTAIAAATSSTVKTSVNRNSANSINFTLGGNSDQISTANKIICSSSPSTGFYKMVFWVKSYSVQSYGTPNKVTLVQLDSSTTPGTSTYYYRVIPKGTNNETLGMDLSSNITDQFTITNANDTSNTLKINTFDTNGNKIQAAKFDLYRSTVSGDTNPTYIGSVGNPPATQYAYFTDIIGNTVFNISPPSNFVDNIYLNPQIVFYDNATVKYGSQYVKVYNAAGAETLSSQSTITTDPIIWKKIEIWFGVSSDLTSQAFDRINLLLNASADYTQSSFYVDNIQIYEVTEFDYLNNQYYSTDSLFSSLRPGESLLNPAISSNSSLRYINYGKWNQSAKPCSFAIQNPQIILQNAYPFKQYIPSIYDRFKYYISQPGLTTTGIQAYYDAYMSINKIVLKISNAFSYPTSTTVTLVTNSGNTTISNISFNNDGIATIYYYNNAWSQTAWTYPPQLTSNGQLQGTLNNVKAIKMAVTGLTVNSNITAEDSTKYSNEIKSLSVIEISPRLEVDLSSLILGMTTTKETSQGEDTLPIGLITSNNATISISNIPVTYNGSPFTIFDNDSTEATFYGLMRQGVKFSISYKSPMSSFTGTIPSGIFYSNNWQLSDISTVNVDTFDQSKILLMSIAAPQYSATNAGLLEIITDLFNISGFSDYDYDSLSNAIDLNVKISYFWSDEQVTLFEVLSNLFISYQITAYFDEYGMLKFLSAKNILDKINSSSFKPDFMVTDASTTISDSSNTSITYSPNIIPNSYSQSIGNKIGKVIINYKTTNTVLSDSVKDLNAQAGLIATKREFVKTIWQEDTSTGLACTSISKSMYPQDNYFYFDPSSLLDPRKTIAMNFGDAFIGSEAVSYEGIEYSFFPTNQSDINIKKIITVPGDIDNAISEIKSYLQTLGLSFKGINFYPTGKAVGVKRGKYNTPINNHFIFDSKAGTSAAIADTVSPSSYFNYYTINSAGTFSSSSTGVIFNYGNAKISSSTLNSGYALSPNEYSGNYNYYAFSFHSSYRQSAQTTLGLFFNKTGSSSTTEFLTLSRYNKNQTQIILSSGSPLGNVQNTSKSVKGTVISGQVLSIDLFDGKEHRVAVYTQSPFVYIFIDGRVVARIKVTINPENLNINSNSNFGTFVMCTGTGIASAVFTEIYAAKFPVAYNTKKIPNFNSFPRYHFQTESYLKNIVHGIPNIVPHYLWQAKPQIRGAKLYDVKHSLSPAIPSTAGLQKVMYGQAKATNNETNLVLERTNAWDVSYSPIAITPFRSRFFAVNNSNQVVYLKAPNDQIGDLTVVPLQIQANYQFLSDQKIVEKIIDSKYISTTIQLDTDWIQGENDAYKILTNIVNLTRGFSREIGIEIFGNPLVQVGDICQFKYTLKRVGTASPYYYFVKSVTNDYNNGLLTKLVLKPIILP